MSHSQPSAMTKALGLQAYDFRNRCSSEGLSEGDDDDDDDGSHKSDSSDDSVGPGIGNNINIGNDKDGDNKDSNAVKSNAAAAIIIHDDDDDDDGSTKFYESESGPYPEPSSLRNSLESSAMDSVMTGDHVNALLKVYEKEDLPKRWNESAGDADDDGIISTNSYRPPWLNNSGGGIVGDSNSMGNGSGDELNGSGHSIKSKSSAPVVPRVRISRREWGSSLETRDCLHDLEEITTEYNGEQLQGGIDAVNGNNGDDKDDHDHDTVEYAEVQVMPMVTPIEGTSLDSRALTKLLWDNDQNENADDQGEEEEEEEEEEEDKANIQNIRGASLRDLKDNLTNKANQLGDMLKKGSGQPPPTNNGTEWTAMTKEDPSTPSSTENNGTNTGADGNNNNKIGDGDGPKLVSRRPICRQATIEYDEIHEDSSSTYIAQNPAPGINDDDNDSAAPANLETFNDGRRPRNRRCTTESESMWTTVGESVGLAFGYNRRTSNESHTTAGSNGTNATNHTNGTNTLGDTGSTQPTVDDIMNGVDDRIDEESQTQKDQTTSLMPMSISPNPSGRKKRRSHRSSWMDLEGVRRSFVRRQKTFGPTSSDASVTPFIDEDGTPHNFHIDDDVDGILIHYRPGQQTVKRCIGVLFAIAVTVASSAAIALAIKNTTTKDGTKQGVYVPISPLEMEGVTLEVAIETIAEHGQYTEDDLFRMATLVDDHCHSEQLSSATGRWECQQICHDHLCCFDVEQGVEEDSVGTYSCRTDENKLCPVFAGCEILVVEDFKENGGKIEDYQQAVAANHGGGGGGGSTTSYNIGEKEEATLIQEESTKEDDLGWQEVRRKYITVYCEESNVQKKAGRKQCQQVCENHFCCFDTSRDGYNCQDDKSMTCDVYEACQVMMVGLFDNVDGTESGTPETQRVNDLDFMPPDMIADFLPLPPPIENTGSEDFARDPMGVLGDLAPDHTIVEYTAAELREMKADVKQRCSDYQSPTGRLQCKKICQDHQCCFDSEPNPATGEAGCRYDPAKLCDVYEPCKVLSGSSNLSMWLVDKKEEEKSPPKVVVVSPDIELGMEGDDENYVDVAAETPEKYLETFDGEEYTDTAGEAEPVAIELDLTSRPTRKRTPEPMIPRTTTPKPTPDASLPPASIPETTVEEQAVPEETPIPTFLPTPKPAPEVVSPPTPPMSPTIPAVQTSAATGKPPPPPPIRCIPEGDDEVHTEIYSDDWNDDRYDRCKRWEKKHGMTISEYWDMQGIDSTLEKNMLESMLIMENGKLETTAAKEEEEEDNNQKGGSFTTAVDSPSPPLEIELVNDLDDAIIDEEVKEEEEEGDSFGEDDLVRLREELEDDSEIVMTDLLNRFLRRLMLR